MIRKQIYLPADEDARLKEIARAAGTSQAAVIRAAIRSRLDEEDERDAAWARLEKLWETLPSLGSPNDRFSRLDAYQDRFERYEEPHRH